jgi:glycylpeptide N-tetradecanoyltransferase
LINDNYIEDTRGIIRCVYGKNFLIWYLDQIQTKGLVIGLLYNNNLIGMISASIFDMIIFDEKKRVPYINFLCIHKKVRHLGLGPILIDHIKEKLCLLNIPYAFFTAMNSPTVPFCQTKDNIIPINYQKLTKIKFMNEELDPVIRFDDNPLHLMIESDTEQIVAGLNSFMKNFKIKPFFDIKSAKHFLLPKKNIKYSFTKKNSKGNITDFISVYKYYLYCMGQKEIVSVGQLGFYYTETLTLTQLVKFLLDKMISYGFDQLIIRNMAENDTIDITKFTTHDELNYFFYNISIPKINSWEIFVLPL